MSIRIQLKESYQIGMTDESFLKFVNWLVAKDPCYVAWSERGFRRVNNIAPYYQAYLEFKRSEE
jgi:hypothetical protein